MTCAAEGGVRVLMIGDIDMKMKDGSSRLGAQTELKPGLNTASFNALLQSGSCIFKILILVCAYTVCTVTYTLSFAQIHSCKLLCLLPPGLRVFLFCVS